MTSPREAARPAAATDGARAAALPDGPPPGTDVWLIGLDAGRGPGPAAGDLDPVERRRARDFRDPVAARRFTTAHAVTRALLGGYLGVPGHTLRWVAGPHGKPVFQGEHRAWRWNVSRSGAHALLAVSRTSAVGVDLERVGTTTPAAALAARFLPADEAARVAARTAAGHAGGRTVYHQLLSRKEACVKAVGGRLLDGLRLPVLSPGPVVGGGAYHGVRWHLRDLPAPRGFVAALATTGAPAGPLRLFTWRPGDGTGRAARHGPSFPAEPRPGRP
ncbi:4'-phosphopantetheinyl transferase family protein [Streptomyces sp. NPDC051569]|uniref:4'-phosphopantetheinyl transferase family protein n=1 Tax=Streptomyces sp. NPDC051569 TaxID=3365661 RepID=UPI0037A64544